MIYPFAVMFVYFSWNKTHLCYLHCIRSIYIFRNRLLIIVLKDMCLLSLLLSPLNEIVPAFYEHQLRIQQNKVLPEPWSDAIV